MHRFFVSVLIVTALCATNGCSTETAKSPKADSANGTHWDSAAGVVIAPTMPYLSAAVSHPAALVITFAPGSIVVPSKPEDRTCEVVAAKQSTVSDAVLWVDGIRQGKPLPQDRRYELVSSGCALSPRIQAVVVGGTVNVFNDDRVLHTLVFIRAGTHDTLQTMAFTNDAELVPSERLTKIPGIVEVRCAQHPQERASIAVFDHPYFGVASPGEKLTLDSVPSGDYQVLTWREGMSTPTAVATKVGASSQSTVVVR